MTRQLNGRFLILLVVVAAGLGGGGYALHRHQVKQTAVLLLARAEKAEEKKDVADALTYYARYLVLRPDDADARARHAKLLASQATTIAQKKRALVVLDGVLRDDPDRADVRRTAVDLAMDTYRYPDAKAHIEYLRKSPAHQNDPELIELLGRCEEEAGQRDEAVKLYQAVIAATPNRVEAYERLANLYRHLGRPADADAVMNQLDQANPNSVRAQLARVRYFRSQRNLADAKASLAKARAEGGDDRDVLLEASEIALAEAAAATDAAKAAKYAEAQAILERGQALFPNDVLFPLQLAELELQAGRPAEAAGRLRKVLPLLDDAKGKPEYRWLAANLLVAADPAAAREQLNLLRTKTDLDPAVVDYLEARLELAAGHVAKATEILVRCRLELAKMTELALQTELLLATCYEKLGAADPRLEAAERAVRLDGTSVAARRAHGDALLALNRLDEAITEYRTVLDRDPGLRLTVARILLYQAAQLPADKRDLSEPVAVLNAAPDWLKKTVDFQLVRVEALLALGQPDKVAEARKALQGVRDKHPTDVRPWLYLAQLDRMAAGSKAALTRLREAEAKVGDSVDLRLAKAALAAGPDDVAALKALEAGADAFPAADRDRLTLGLAEAYIRVRALADAERLLRQAADRAPDDPAILSRLYDVLLDREADPAVLKPVVDKLQKAEGKDGAVWLYADAARHWRAYRQTKDPADLRQALDLLAAAGKRRPRWARPPLLEAQIADATDQGELAIDKYKQALDLGARYPEVVQRTVQLLTARRRTDEAQEVLGKVPTGVALPPALGRYATELSLLRHDPKERTLELAERTKAKDSKDYRDHVWLGQVYWAAAKPQEAEAAFRRAIDLDPKAPEPWVALVTLLTRTDRVNEARVEVERAARTLPTEKAAAALAPCYEALRDRAEAEKYYLALVQAAPDDLGLRRSLAAFYLAGGEVAKAKPVLNQMIRQSGDAVGIRAWARRALALTLASSGEYADSTAALELIQANLAERPQAPEDARAQALILAVRPGGRRESIQKLEASFAVLRPSPGEEFLLAQLYEAEGDWPKANSWLLSLVSGTGGADNVTFLAYYVRALLRHKNPAEAAAWLARLEQKDPGSPRTVELKARLLAEQDRKAEAGTLLKTFARDTYKAKGNPVVLLSAGRVLADMGVPADAEELLKQYVQEAREKTPAAPLALAEFYGRQNRPADALAVCEKALPAAGPELTARYTVGIIRLAENVGPAEMARAEALITAAVQKKPEALDLQVSLADLRDAQQRYADAKQIYRQVLKLDGRNQLALNNLAWLLAVEEGKTQEGLELINRAIQNDGPVGNLLDTRGMILLKSNRTDEAIADLSGAASQSPNDPTPTYHLALAYHRKGNARDAERLMNKAVELGLTPRILHRLELPDYQVMAKLVEPPR